MSRLIDLFLILLMTGSAVLTYQVKMEAENEYAVIKRLEAAVKLEQDTIDLLKVDWGLLNQPERLQKLSKKYTKELGLQTTGAEQIKTLDELPGLSIESVLGVSNSSLDGVHTGGVKQ